MPEREQDDSPLERMRKRLYSAPSVDAIAPHSLPSSHPSAPEHWQPDPIVPQKPTVSGAAVFLIAAGAFFLIAAGVTVFMLFLGGRSVSADKVAIAVEGPTNASGGEAVPLLITIRNDNPVAIQGATLRLTFPEGTGEADDPSVSLAYHEEELGDIPAGASLRRTVRASFFGAEDQALVIPIEVEYTTGNSNAVFRKDSSYELVIANAPVIIAITTLSEIAAGQPLTLSLSVRSNATTPLQNVAVRADYPFGFIEGSAEPARSAGSFFMLGTLAPGEERDIRITGTLSGQEREERVFRFTAGALKDEGAREFAVAYTEKQSAVTIAKPFLTVDLSLNRSDDEEIVVRTGEIIAALVSWENALNSIIQDGRITVRLSGDALDPADVQATNAFYQSAQRTVLFDRDTAPGLARINPGNYGNGSFTFHTRTGSTMDALRNPSITLDVSISGRRIGETGVAESITSTMQRVVKVQTDLGVEMQAIRTEGPFENSGPWPPKVGEETTYTIEWKTTNTVNTTGGVTVRATLPAYVRFTGQTTPSGAVSYTESSREVVWNIGEVAPGSEKTAAFQIALLPSVSQKGTSPTLVSDAVVRGFDRFVQKDVTATAESVDIQTFNDSGYQNSFGAVAQ